MAVIKGSQKETGELPPIECTYQGCIQRFATEKDMKRHKVGEPTHFYCKKCDLDCKDRTELTQHKVQVMSAWMNTSREERDESPKHITCEFCGEDFKSFGGRKLHRQQAHPADQDLRCPAYDKGCHEIFFRAAGLVAHLEQGYCEFITQREFQAAVVQKHVSSIVWHNADVFRANLQINKAFSDDNDTPGLITDGSETLDQEDGGVSLLDREHLDQVAGYKPLQPEVDLMDKEYPVAHKASEPWPRLHASPGLSESMNSMTIGCRSPSVASRTTSISGFASDVTSRRGGQRVYTESYPSLGSPVSVRSIYADDDNVSEVTTTAASAITKASAWSTGNTSKALFNNAKPALKPGDWAAVSKRKEEEVLASSTGGDLVRSRWYDPQSTDYNVERFLHSVTGKYTCPFPDCGCEYDVPSDIANHLVTAHCQVSFNCTTCMKRFKSATALVGHMESTGRCRVKDSKDYMTLLDHVTGGFLKAKEVYEPRVYEPQTAVVKAGEPTNGVMRVKFKSKMPLEPVTWSNSELEAELKKGEVRKEIEDRKKAGPRKVIVED